MSTNIRRTKVSVFPSTSSLDNDEGSYDEYAIKVYRPTLEEMKDFSAYIKLIHETGGHRAGLAKIIPPKEYKPRKGCYDDEKLYRMTITNPIRQHISGSRGLYSQYNVAEKKEISVRNFISLAENKHPTPLHQSYEELERLFWKNVSFSPSLYGADVPGSLYDDDVEEFNLTRLNTILDNIAKDYGVTIQGVNTAYLYFGMWKTAFSWHTEDMDLYSINYLHSGAPKSWYCIPPEHGKRFERLAASFYPDSFRTCRAFLRHKTTMISPQVLKKYSIPFSKITQEKGEFMITFPYSYHSGYNHGFNIAEATNFAVEYWVEFGKWASRCKCTDESVKISMQTFVKRYQPDRYDKWVKGRDVCKDPRDPKSNPLPAPLPTDYDLYLQGRHDRKEMNQETCVKDGEVENKFMNDFQNETKECRVKTKAERKAIPSLTQAYEQLVSCLRPSVNQINEIQAVHHTSLSDKMISVKAIKPIIENPKRKKNNHLKAQHDEHQTINTINYTFIPRNTNHIFEPITNGNISINDLLARDRLVKEQIQAAKKLKLDAMMKERDIIKEKQELKRDLDLPLLTTKQLLYFLPTTFTHEKRFNRCISRVSPYCSVCQLLTDFPEDDPTFWNNDDSFVDESNRFKVCDGQNQSSNSPVIVSGATSNQNTCSQSIDIQTNFKLPEKSSVLLPSTLFTYLQPSDEDTSRVERQKSKADSNILEGNLDFIEQELQVSSLVQCSVCMLCVHKLCYGIGTQTKDEGLEEGSSSKDWMCDRCIQKNNRSRIVCELCPCRGGALKEVSNGKWVHITCVLMLPEVRLLDVIYKKHTKGKTLSIEKLDIDKKDCMYCMDQVNKGFLVKYLPGNCIGCDVSHANNKCETKFHPTCGHRNGVKFRVADWPMNLEHDTTGKMRQESRLLDTLRITCTKHCLNSSNNSEQEDSDDEEEKNSLQTIKEGSKVIALYNKNDYRNGCVKKIDTFPIYEVYFPQLNSTDPTLREESIKNLKLEHEYHVGEEMEADSGEGIMKAKFICKRTEKEYQVGFEDGSVKIIPRKHIFLNVDQLSDEVYKLYHRSKPTSHEQ